MDRRTFIKALISTVARLPIPFDAPEGSSVLAGVTCKTVAGKRDLFEVHDRGVLLLAKWEQPTTRAELYGLSIGDIAGHIDGNQGLQNVVRVAYADWLEAANHDAIAHGTINGSDLEVMVEDGWSEWFGSATSDDRRLIDERIREWLGEEPDFAEEWDSCHVSGDAQGAAHRHFLAESPDVLSGLGIRIVDGDHPASSYFAAELGIPVKDANAICERNDWPFSFSEMRSD